MTYLSLNELKELFDKEGPQWQEQSDLVSQVMHRMRMRLFAEKLNIAALRES